MRPHWSQVGSWAAGSAVFPRAADSTSLDPQAKGLAEQLRAVWVDVPEELL